MERQSVVVDHLHAVRHAFRSIAALDGESTLVSRDHLGLSATRTLGALQDCASAGVADAVPGRPA